MAQVAPGLGPDRNDRPCYNCGVRGHMFNACPEEPRKVPAGLEASWARHQSSNSPQNDNFAPNKRSKGPVITRYPPPPPAASHHPPPLPRFDNSPPQHYPPGSVPAYPPPNPPYDRYGPPGPPGPPPPLGPQQLNPPGYHNLYPPSYGPPGPVPGPFDHHRASLPARPNYYPNDYPSRPPGRPDPYPPPNQFHPGPPGPPPYVSQSQYPSGPPPPYPPPPSFGHSPPPFGYQGPPGYAQREYNHPQREPPPSLFNHQYSPPDSYGQPYGDERDRYPRDRDGDRQRRYDDRRPAEPWHAQDGWHNPSSSSDQAYRDEYRDGWHGKHSNRDDRPPRRWGHGKPGDERRRDRHDRSHPYKNSDKSDRHNRRKQQSVRTPSRTAPSERRERSPLDRGTPIVVKTDQEREPGEIISEPTSASEHDNTDNILNAIPEKDEEDLSWDERTIFQEPLVTIKVDPIAAPLPAEYSEDVMIPPAFDAKALKSQYITPRNVDDFSQSVRETRDWQVMKYHPVFLNPEDICPDKLRDYYKAAKKDVARYNQRERPGNYLGISKQRYGNSKGSGRQHGKNQETRHKPDQRKRRWNDFHDDADEDRTERRYRDSPYDDMLKKKLKPASPEPGEVIEDESQESPYEPPDAQIVTTDNTERLRESGVIKDAASRDFSANNGSNGSSQEATSQRDTQRKSTKTQLSTPLALTEDNLSSYDQLSSRNSSQSFHGKSPRSRRTSIGSQDSVSGGSDLDSIDRELLGLAEPEAGSSEVKEEPLKQQQLNKITPKRKRRQQMSAAYSRRW